MLFRSVESIAGRLRFSNQDRDRIVALTAHHMRFRNVRDMRLSKLKRFLREEFFPELLELHRIDCQASHGLLDLYEFCREALVEATAGETQALRPERRRGGERAERSVFGWLKRAAPKSSTRDV